MSPQQLHRLIIEVMRCLISYLPIEKLPANFSTCTHIHTYTSYSCLMILCQTHTSRVFCPVQVCAVIGGILIIADFFRSTGGWFFFVGFWFIVYMIIVIVIESCLHFGMHKLIDAIVLFAYAALWLLSAILNISFAIAIADALLGVASVSI